MRITQAYPVLMLTDPATAAAYFTRHFGFASIFAADWYIHLRSTASPEVNLALLAHDHATIPAPTRGTRATGLLLNFEVADVDAEAARLASEGLNPVQPLRSEAFGQRHAIYPGPEGMLIDLITPIAMTGAFTSQRSD